MDYRPSLSGLVFFGADVCGSLVLRAGGDRFSSVWTTASLSGKKQKIDRFTPKRKEISYHNLQKADGFLFKCYDLIRQLAPPEP